MTKIDSKQDLHVDVNLPALLRNFGEAFSGDRIWIRELLQNARRAKASEIRICTNVLDDRQLRIKDDGCGIPDMQALLTLGASGWDSATINQENPFGLGFYAALYAAETLIIRSNNQRLVIEVDKLLNGEKLRPEASETPVGTEIGIILKKSPWTSDNPSDEEMRKQLESLVEGFPIPVYLDDYALNRPYALDAWEGLRFDLDKGIALVELDPGIDYHDRRSKSFFQGLNISGNNLPHPWPNFGHRGMRVFMHLQSNDWRLRVPDRDTLYRSDQTDKDVRQLDRDLCGVAVGHIIEAGETSRYFDVLLYWGYCDAIRNCPIPPDRWHVMTSSLHLPHYEEEDCNYATEQLEEGLIPNPENDFRFIRDFSMIDPNEETIGHLFAAYQFNIPFLDSWDDPGHWFSKTAQGESLDDFYDHNLSISVHEEDRIAEGSWWGKKVVLCKRFFLTLEGYGTKEVIEAAFIEDTFWIVDRPAHFYYPIDHAFGFQMEFGDFDETAYDNAMNEFRAHLAIMKNDLCGLILSAIDVYQEALDGHAFSVRSKNGALEISLIS